RRCLSAAHAADLGPAPARRRGGVGSALVHQAAQDAASPAAGGLRPDGRGRAVRAVHLRGLFAHSASARARQSRGFRAHLDQYSARACVGVPEVLTQRAEPDERPAPIRFPIDRRVPYSPFVPASAGAQELLAPATRLAALRPRLSGDGAASPDRLSRLVWF